MGMYLNVTRLSAAQTKGLVENPESVSDLLEEDLPRFDVDKAWGDLDYLLAKLFGDAGGFLLAGGERIGELEDYDFGPPRLFVPENLSEMVGLLEGVSEESLRLAYNPKDMDAQGVYPSVWERDGDEGFGWLMTTFVGFRDFVRTTANGGDALMFELG